MPDLGQLRAFVAVAEERNFTRAAKSLFMAQQAVSKSVATLESQLGVALFHRTSHDVTLTPSGELLLRKGKTAMQAVDDAFAEATAIGRGLAGTLHVGITPAVGAASHPRIATALTTGTPDLRVTFHEMRPAEGAELLRQRQLDLVLTRVKPSSTEFRYAQLRPSPAVVLVDPGHRLAHRERIEVAELDGQSLQLWSPPGETYTDDVVRRLARLGARVQVEIAAVIGGSGPPILDRNQFALRPVGWPDLGLVTLTFNPPGLTLPLWVYWTTDATEPAVARLRNDLG